MDADVGNQVVVDTRTGAQRSSPAEALQVPVRPVEEAAEVPHASETVSAGQAPENELPEVHNQQICSNKVPVKCALSSRKNSLL